MPQLAPSICSRLWMPALLSVLLAACGGGGGGTEVAGGGSNENCEIDVKSGFIGNGPTDQNGTEGEGGDGAGDGGDGGGGIGAGGSLGQFRNTKVIVRDPVSGKVLGEGVTDNEKGMVTLTPCSPEAPLEVAFVGGADATYFDEAKKAFVPFGPGRELRVRVSNATRGFIGVTPYTEAAVRLTAFQEGEASIGPGGVNTKVVTKGIDDSNRQVASILADQLPGVYRSSDAGGRFEITGLPVILNDQNVDSPGTLTDNNRGRYGAANAGLAVLAGTFLADDPTPALTVSEQLARDLSDGKLDLVDSNGCSIASGSTASGCGPDTADIGYTYETLWRAKTVATSQASQSAGDQSLASKRAFVAVYRIASNKAYRSCAFPNGVCIPLLRATNVQQTVSLDSSGRLTLKRGMTAPFGDQLRFITAETDEVRVDGEFVEVKVGSRGEVIALTRDRSEFVYIDPLRVYEVTGQEQLENFQLVDDVLTRRLQELQLRRIPVTVPGISNPRVASFTPSPGARVFLDNSAGVPPAFLYLLPNGLLRAVRPAAAEGSFQERWGAPQQTNMSAPARLSSVVYDKYAPPGFESAYGPAPGNPVVLPYRGPRRLYGLTRQGKVTTWLEGAQAAGRQLDVPGRVVQIVAEATSSVVALNSDGKVFWLNPDQAFNASTEIDGRGQTDFPRRFALNTVQAIDIPEKICWLARAEAVACESGNVYRWTEDLLDFVQEPTRFNACGVGSAGQITDQTVDVAKVGRGISGASRVNLATDIGAIWRLNAADEFTYERRGTFRETCQIDGIRYLGVNGKETDQGGAEGRRSIATTKAPFPNLPFGETEANFITGLQLRTAFESANAAFAANGASRQESTGPLGLTASVEVRAQPGQGVISHITRVRGGQGATETRPDLTVLGNYQSSGGSSSVQLTRVNDETVGRAIAITGGPVSWSDNDNIILGLRPLGEWQLLEPNAGCGDCRDEREQSRRTQAMILPTVDSEDQYAFKLCFRIRVEGRETADIRFACTKHDNDGQFTGISMTDRVLFSDGSLSLVDFMHF